MDTVEAFLETEATSEPIIAPPKSTFTSIRLYVRLWIFKAFVKVGLGLARLTKARGHGTLHPTYKKAYLVGAKLKNDVWIPKSYKSGQTLPLYIDIHGGGFAVGDPETDASYCDYLANQHDICVISINYRKAPRYPFPYQTQDLTEIITQVLEDPELPVDKTKVAVGGFSAGGNLSLSSSLRDELQGKIKGLVLWYPVTDFSGQFKGEFKTGKDGSPDILAKTAELFNHGYVPAGQDRRDPFLSPIYADRSKLPEKILFLGAELDYLCQEAEITAKKYAHAEKASRVGEENDWQAGGITWKRISNAQHGFNFIQKKDPETEAERKKITAEANAIVAKWLKAEIYT